MRRLKYLMGVVLLSACFFLVGCGTQESASNFSDWKPTGSMDLQYADQFSVDYYDGGYALITIAKQDQYLLVPEGKQAPQNLSRKITVLQQPLNNIYLAASSAMDLFDGLDALDSITMTSTAQKDWSLPPVTQAMQQGKLQYVGKYNAPDYETLLAQKCQIAVESTMITHNPEVKEQLEKLNIPVLVEHSSYEAHPLGRMEWIKLYGLLLGKTEEAQQFFDEKVQQVNRIQTTDTGKTVAFFYISSTGSVNVRKPGDYVSKMIDMAGGSYVPTAQQLKVEDNALSTMNMQMEAFYAAAKDADYIIYNSTIEGDLQSISQLTEKSGLLKDFKAVRDGNVWCTEKNMFQQTTGAADMIEDLNRIVTGQADQTDQLTFLHRLK